MTKNIKRTYPNIRISHAAYAALKKRAKKERRTIVAVLELLIGV